MLRGTYLLPLSQKVLTRKPKVLGSLLAIILIRTHVFTPSHMKQEAPLTGTSVLIASNSYAKFLIIQNRIVVTKTKKVPKN